MITQKKHQPFVPPGMKMREFTLRAVLLGLVLSAILEENLARTAGSIGESVAAGAIFTLPAFVIAHAWPSFDTPQAYWQSTVLMVTGGVLGVLFTSLMRRVM